MGINFTKETDFVVRAYSDSDWGGCPSTRRSTGGFCTFLGSNLLSWSSLKQPSVSRSSTEAEYRSLSETATELHWIGSVMRELGIPMQTTPELYCDNLSSVHLTANPSFHKRSKHFELDYHYVRERVALKALVVRHIPAQQQLADIFTKSLSAGAFQNLRAKLGVVVPPSLSLRGAIGTLHESKQNDTALPRFTKEQKAKAILTQTYDEAQVQHKPIKALSINGQQTSQRSETPQTVVHKPAANRTSGRACPMELSNPFSALDQLSCT